MGEMWHTASYGDQSKNIYSLSDVEISNNENISSEPGLWNSRSRLIPIFLYVTWTAVHMCNCLPGEVMAPESMVERVLKNW